MRGAPILNVRTGRVWGMLLTHNSSVGVTNIRVMPFREMKSEIAEYLQDRQAAVHHRRWAFALGERDVEFDQPPDEPNLLFRLYIPHERLYAVEARQLLTLFREWLIATLGYRVRQAGYNTAAGELIEFFADDGEAAAPDLIQQIDKFASFLTLCTADPDAAITLLAEAALGRTASIELVRRFRRDAHRLELDMRHERAQRMLSLQRNIEDELLEKGVDLAAVPTNQITELVESLVPGAAASVPLALPTTLQTRQSPQLNFQINHGLIIHSVAGNLHYGAAAQQFLELIDSYGDREATLLKSAVYEFEDADAPQARRSAAKYRLKQFLSHVGTVAQGVGTELFAKYLESKGF
jgi:hypothetical protein